MRIISFCGIQGCKKHETKQRQERVSRYVFLYSTCFSFHGRDLLEYYYFCQSIYLWKEIANAVIYTNVFRINQSSDDEYSIFIK